MKILTAILSFYIFALTAIPCIDGHQDTYLNKTELGSKTTDNHENNTDHCSPFCTCSCCASPIIYQAFAVLFNDYSLIQEYYSEFKSDFISTLHASIWQPPKLS